tara:strand:- start:1001 stop:1552 length:552 start_codon:yes stop_codon:yes gene_type:complete
MNKISRDSFSIILESLQCDDIDNLKQVNKQIADDVHDLSMIYKKNQIKELWGNEIFQIIYNSINLHKPENLNLFLEKENMDTIVNVIEIFYKDFITNKTKITTKLFIEVYSLFFSLCVKDQNNKDILFEHRKQCILKMFKKEDIVSENAKLKSLFGVSSYINRYHDILGRRITYREFINEFKH